jgi:NAD(P) transhydrogenase subunit alpha
MNIGVPKETWPGEQRVSIIPTTVASLKKTGLHVSVEQGAGNAAGFHDDEYEKNGATITSRDEIFQSSDVILQVRAMPVDPKIRQGQVVIGFADPLGTPQEIRNVASTGITLFAMELMPRITRAQSMDALSSMATVTGYKGVLLAADALPRMMPMLMTAAGTLSPAKIFVVGAGVAGLQAIATARRLGALVKAYDVRPAVKEQVQSLGAKFVELPLESTETEDAGGYAKAQDESFYRRQREMMLTVLAASNAVITTALIPGRQAPILVTKEMVNAMQPGSVVVDLAAERGGNCELTKPDEVVNHKGVTIIGPSNPPALVPYHASQMYSKNIATFLLHLIEKDEKKSVLQLDMQDEITKDTLLTKGGTLVNKKVLELVES